jgi:DnaK suppressor protein
MALSRDELDALQRALVARARALRGEVSDKLGEAASDSAGMNTGGDQVDQAAGVAESAMDLAEAQRDLNELRAIDAALHALGEGTYGYCASCGIEIPDERLRVQPLAVRCVACQSRSERHGGEPRALY